MLNGLDLFSGIGGISIALREWVRPIAYCEIDPYCQGILLSKMDDKLLYKAPICTDVRFINGTNFNGLDIDIIYGGFPCQDISIAGNGKGLEGERSGLYKEILRLAKEIKPSFIFLENVAAITSRGGIRIVNEIAEMGYDCRWCVISAASVGALHRRERWFLLGHSQHNGSLTIEKRRIAQETISNNEKGKNETGKFEGTDTSGMLASELMAYSRCNTKGSLQRSEQTKRTSLHTTGCRGFWEIEPSVGRMADGIPNRVDRIKALGNSVVSQQAKEAFKILMGLK
jgi:DNA (cytosine-5)-methyltransferase 1